MPVACDPRTPARPRRGLPRDRPPATQGSGAGGPCRCWSGGPAVSGGAVPDAFAFRPRTTSAGLPGRSAARLPGSPAGRAGQGCRTVCLCPWSGSRIVEHGIGSVKPPERGSRWSIPRGGHMLQTRGRNFVTMGGAQPPNALGLSPRRRRACSAALPQPGGESGTDRVREVWPWAGGRGQCRPTCRTSTRMVHKRSRRPRPSNGGGSSRATHPAHCSWLRGIFEPEVPRYPSAQASLRAVSLSTSSTCPS